jgi:hypothetical protein
VPTAQSLIHQNGFGFISIAYGSGADLNKLAAFSGGSDCVIQAGISGVQMSDAVSLVVNKMCKLVGSIFCMMRTFFIVSGSLCNSTVSTPSCPATAMYDIVIIIDISTFMKPFEQQVQSKCKLL